MTTTEPDTRERPTPDLEAYRFHETDWPDYDTLVDAFDWEIPEECNIATYVCDRWAEFDPDRVALAVTGPAAQRELTFADLQAQANQLASAFSSQGIQRGDRIAVAGSQHPACLATHLAAWKLGAISVPLSVRFGPDALAYRLQDAEARAFVVDPVNFEAFTAIRDSCPTIETVLTIGDTDAPRTQSVDAFRAGHETAFDTASTLPSTPAILFYTSGTTGQPKGVLHSHDSLLGVLPSHLLSARNLRVDPDDLMYSPAEWSWVGPFLHGVLGTLYYGTPVLADPTPEFDPARVFELINRYGISIIGGATTIYRLMMQVPTPDATYDLSSMRVVIGAGESLGQSVVDWWCELVDGVAVHEAYGQTETGVIVGDCNALGQPHEPGRMGVTVPGATVRVVHPETREGVADGEIGEVELAVDDYPGVFTEYWNQPSATAETVTDGWLRTGDLATRDANGSLAFHSRRDDVIISSGYRIGPGEIEECLAAHDAVAQVGVVGVPDETRGEVPKAFIVTAPDVDPSEELATELTQFVKDQLAKHEYPRDLEFVDELPLTTTGKVRRAALRDRV